MNTIIVSQQKWYASKHKYAMIGKIQVDRHNKTINICLALFSENLTLNFKLLIFKKVLKNASDKRKLIYSVILHV